MAAAAPESHALAGEVQANVCVVGGGYTGLKQTQKAVDVVLPEVLEAGFGGSGRNAGHCMPTFIYFSLPRIHSGWGSTRS